MEETKKQDDKINKNLLDNSRQKIDIYTCSNFFDCLSKCFFFINII